MRLLAVLFSIVLVFCGCSSSEESVTWRIARDPSWYPLDLMGKEAAVLGFSDDLISAIATVEHVHLQLYLSSWASLEEGLRQGRWDGILSSIPPILGFKDRYSFSDPYIILGPVLVVPQDSKVTSIAEMEGNMVGILAGSASVTFLEQYPSILIEPYDSLAQALEDLSMQKIQGVLMPALPAYGYVRDIYQGILKVVTQPLSDEALRLVSLNGEDPEMLEMFNRGLARVKQMGQYDALLKKWKLH